jgi:hypothetical protein
MRIKPSIVHVVQAITEGALIAALVVGLIAGTAFAANGNGKSSLSLVMVTAAAPEANNEPNFGDQVTFNVSTTATNKPYVNLNCYQDGKWVEGDWGRFYDDPIYPWSRNFNLGPTQLWQGGAADCTARLVMFSSRGNEKTLATTSFHVNG